jgi:hypothetical protein
LSIVLFLLENNISEKNVVFWDVPCVSYRNHTAHIPENNIIYSHRLENLLSDIARFIVNYFIQLHTFFAPISNRITFLWSQTHANTVFGTQNKQANSVALSPQANSTDWATATFDEI